ncbi:sushi, von Willebrand factor type A, EGF and pentraxin domain-containing protein 1 isoform X2 [Aethina tumida]|uniref:sushi, von Willebrand factor type A, EGF and pentraxin domain-containing protein 1 isoform X2 n=1 Tax=Aethina tumida TaxID=116153 RepID=UPI0021480EDE|nr:sushi, von Willebrand factor type A, EGF and pentraxin domain-containing protein 1 isoform X2 [Aethina tumida]
MTFDIVRLHATYAMEFFNFMVICLVLCSAITQSTSNHEDGGLPSNSTFLTSFCPRDEQATLLGRTCQKLCISDKDCKDKTKCLCDGECGMSCVDPELECPVPDGIPNGTINSTGRTFASTSSYSCSTGYQLVGPAKRTCQADGKWSGETPTCLSSSNETEIFVRLIRSADGTTTPTPDDDDDDWEEEDSSEIDDDGRIYKNPRNSPSTLCPRDEEQATLLGQKCLRKCSSDEDCKSKKKKCLCDGACGMSCIKPDRECPEPEEIAFGSVSVSGRLFGARATYSCQHGYHVVGLQSRTCQGDGKWAGTAPACKQNIYCLSPPTIDHARHNALPEQTTFDLDTTLQYYCHNGYVTNGFPRAKCLAIDGQASWYGPDMSCEPRSCGAPTDISHGWHAGECYTFGCRITYHCAEGYELVGRNERFCQSDGTWTPKELPTCVLVTAVQCAPPENPRHGKAVYTSCSYNSVVSYECKYGYTLVGESTRRCGADRKWTGNQPMCKEINCGHPGRLWNGWLENIEGGTGLGASIIFRCHDGMLLEGNTSSVCQIDGKWRYPLPRCLAPCVVPHVTQGRVLLLSRNDTATTSTVVQHGEALAVDCDPQYEFLASVSEVTCNNGTWTEIPKCDPARCKNLPKSPKYGMVMAPKMEHGMRARFKCKDGYVLRGNPLVKCDFGNWTGEVPKCEEVYCPYPGNVQNGKILLVGNMGLYDYRPYVRKVINNKQIMYDCDKGYVLSEGPPGATCIGGKWSPSQLPTCLLGQHPRLRWNRRRRSIVMEKYKRAYIRHHKLILNQREKRYIHNYLSELNSIFDAKIVRKYLRRKTLAERITEAMRLAESRRKKRALKGGSSSRTFSTTHKSSNSQLSLRRNNKKMKNNIDDNSEDEFAVSKPSNKHKNKGPCEALSSEPYVNVEVVKHGKDPNVSYSSGTVVKMACGLGYGLNMPENKTAKCMRGKWKPVKPMCLILPCFVPLTPNGIYKLSKSNLPENYTLDPDAPLNETIKIENGQVVEFSCEEGYNVQGPSNLRCWHGDWTVTSLPECTPAPCQLPKIPNGQYMSGYRHGLTIANGSSVTFQCDNDYSTSAAQPIQCLLGQLYPKEPNCKSEDGGEGILENKVVQTPEYLGGSDIVKGGDITVVDYGILSGKYCGPPAKVRGSIIYKNGEPLVDDENNFPDGTEVTFNCIESIMGEKTTWKIICEDGSWIGRSFNCDEDDLLGSQNINNNTCIFRNQEPNVISFYNDQQIREEVVEFPAGAVLISRCVDIGKYAMIGPNKRKCLGGEWDGTKPACFGLNQENDYSMEKPPTILFRHQLGPIAQSNDGKLIVYPGTILHMECLWIRRFGNPKWTVSHDYRKYPEGWSTDPGRDSQLEYRLSIFHATKDDSGLFTCVTPARYTHSVEIVVKAVHCPAVQKRRGLSISSQKTKMNTRIHFSCTNGNALIGAPEITCLPSGNWSSPFPICEKVTCDPPAPPENGYVQGTGPYKAGDVIQFNCNPDFMMEGQPIIACQENGRWSGKLPKCQQACSYPGTTISGRMSSVKFYYKIGENITFTCDDGMQLKGAAMLKCLRSGKWSNAIPTCIPDNSQRR